VVRIPTRFLAVVNNILFSTRFEARSPNCEKRLRVASCLSVCLPACLFAWNDWAPHLADFHEILHLNSFRKYVEIIRVLSKSVKNNGYFTFIPIYIYNDMSLNSP